MLAQGTGVVLMRRGKNRNRQEALCVFVWCMSITRTYVHTHTYHHTKMEGEIRVMQPKLWGDKDCWWTPEAKRSKAATRRNTAWLSPNWWYSWACSPQSINSVIKSSWLHAALFAKLYRKQTQEKLYLCCCNPACLVPLSGDLLFLCSSMHLATPSLAFLGEPDPETHKWQVLLYPVG